MASYKLYILGPTGMIARGVWLDCESDAAAIQTAEAQACGEARELWAGGRLIRTFDVGGGPAAASAKA